MRNKTLFGFLFVLVLSVSCFACSVDSHQLQYKYYDEDNVSQYESLFDLPTEDYESKMGYKTTDNLPDKEQMMTYIDQFFRCFYRHNYAFSTDEWQDCKPIFADEINANAEIPRQWLSIRNYVINTGGDINVSSLKLLSLICFQDANNQNIIRADIVANIKLSVSETIEKPENLYLVEGDNPHFFSIYFINAEDGMKVKSWIAQQLYGVTEVFEG